MIIASHAPTKILILWTYPQNSLYHFTQYEMIFNCTIERLALRKLVMLHSANAIDDLRTPPGNMLELLRGDRAGQYSIRINRQWRICFTWRNGDAYHVEICDYH